MSLTVLAGELRTGRVLAQVPVESCSWSMVHRDAGSVSVSIPLRSVEVQRRPGLLSALDPARCYLAVVTDSNRVLQAGPIWRHTWDTSGSLDVQASGLWSVWEHRRAVPTLNTGQRVQDAKLDYTGLDLGSIAVRLVQDMMSHPGGDLPLVLEPLRPGANERHYLGFELASTAERLKQLMEVQDGPDIAFEPRMSGDGLSIQWVMRTGSASDPMLHQSGADWVWDTTPVRSSASSLSVTRDASGMASRQWAVGSGTDDEKLIASAQDWSQVDRGWPLLEEDATYSSVLDTATLASHAAGDLRAATRPWTTWKMTTLADGNPLLGEYRPGDWASIYIDPADPYLGLVATNGQIRTRITGVSGSLGTTVDITLQPVMEVR